jgi:hypothetical protein
MNREMGQISVERSANPGEGPDVKDAMLKIGSWSGKIQ